MIILIPMGGFGTRFSEAGYKINKPCLPTFDRHSGQLAPMILAAMKDIPEIHNADTKIICINREFHAEDGTEKAIYSTFPQTKFIHDFALLDQAFACLLAREFLLSDDELLIGACDNGLIFNEELFEQKRSENDVLVITHSNDENIKRNPNAHSWLRVSADESVKEISVKSTISEYFENDQATTGMFWFKSARVFLSLLEEMLSKGRITDRKVLDGVIGIAIERQLKTSFVEVDYLCWGTPPDYEDYQSTAQYWSSYIDKNPWL